MVGLVALLVVGCTPTDAVDSATSPYDPQCDPVTVSLVESWETEDLPALAPLDRIQEGAAVGDIDGDGWLDVLFAYGAGGMGFRNDGTGRLLADPAITVDGGPVPPSAAVALADVDADGDLDAWLGRQDGAPDLLLFNDGTARFTSVPLDGSEGSARTGVFADFNGDSRLDLFVAEFVSGFDTGEVMSGVVETGDISELYLQEPDGTFRHASDQLPADSTWGLSWQAAAVDADQDDDLDVYLANDAGPYILPNRLLVNDGTGHFTRGEDCLCEISMFGMGTAVGDANGDALADLFVTDVAGPNLLVAVGDGKFADASVALNAGIPWDPEHFSSWGTAFTDLDRDSWSDILVIFGQTGADPEQLDELSEGAGWVEADEQFDVVLAGGPDGFSEPETGWHDGSRKRSLALGDLDRDGDVDFVVIGKHFLRQWETDGGCDNALAVRLHDGTGTNVDAVGARVEVEVGDHVTRQWMLPATMGSSSAHELYFGLGDRDHADSVRVRWADGSEQEVGSVDANSPVTVER